VIVLNFSYLPLFGLHLNYLVPTGIVLNLHISFLIGFHKNTSHLTFILRRIPSVTGFKTPKAILQWGEGDQ
jgi:hypothetical protein